MGILRSEPELACGAELVWDGTNPEDPNPEEELPLDACRVEGIAAARMLPLPTARNSLRAIPNFREFAMPSPNEDRTRISDALTAQKRRRSRGHYTTLCGKRN